MEYGAYDIIKNGKSYGTYDDIRDAMHDRDILMDCDWDMTEMCARDEIPNKYKDMELPPSRKYITEKRQGNRVYYTIRKTINGVRCYFGHYKTFEDAVKKRDELEEIGWCVD